MTSPLDRPPIHFYNTLTRSKDAFEPIAPPRVSFYSCGPTVYNYVHIGNLRAFVFYDLLRRYLDWRGLQVVHVMNITDVDDKMIKKAQAEGKTLRAVADTYEGAFLEDLRRLNVVAGWGREADDAHPPTALPRATESIDAMVALVQKLIDQGIAYRSEDGSVYFSIARFEAYGRLSRLQTRELKEGARVSHDEYEKEEARDFALWKAWVEGDGEVFWETPLGKGRPGWHLECSVMSMEAFGPTLDIHAGGVDLVFPHHENEIAQAEAATGEPFVRFFMHNEHLMVDGKKMEKRAGTVYRLRELVDEHGHSALAVRYALMSVHYRQQLNFTFDGLAAAQGAIDRLTNAAITLAGRREAAAGPAPSEEQVAERLEAARAGFDAALADDLNVSEALAAVFDLVGWANRAEPAGPLAEQILMTLYDLDRVLGLGLKERVEKATGTDADPDAARIDGLLKEREQARKDKKWARADEIRDELAAEGVELVDTPEGTRWQRK